jgi:hypothetical protein
LPAKLLPEAQRDENPLELMRMMVGNIKNDLMRVFIGAV